MGVSVAVAIVVGLVSSFVQSLGLTIQRKSHVQDDALPLTSRRRPLRRPLWLIGFAIYITSNIFSTIFQLDALPIIILAPLGAVSLIFNALLARVILGDVFGRTAMVGTALVALGAVLIAVFGVVQEEEHSLDELMELWRRGPFLAFFLTMVAVVVIVLTSAHIVAWHTQRQLSPGGIKLEDDVTPPSSSIAPSNYASPRSPKAIPFRFTSNSTKAPQHVDYHDDENDLSPSEPLLLDTAKQGVRFATRQAPPLNLTIDLPPTDPAFSCPTPRQQRTLTLTGLAFAAASGTLSGMSLVLAKAAVELLVITLAYFRTGKGENQFVRPESWFLVAGLGIGAVLQLVYLNYSLTFASPALICPLAFCFFNLSSIFDGLVFYDQIGRLKTYQIVLVSVGVAILLLGVWVVSLIQPAGGGVEVGTWAEDDECSETDYQEDDHATLLGGTNVAEPEVDMSPSPSGSPQVPWTPSGSSSPYCPGVVSPTRRRSGRARFGSLIPDYTHGHGHGHIAPTGFSIGLGAASPGFVLRPTHGNGGGHGHRGRTLSEGQAGILNIINGASSTLADGSRASIDSPAALSSPELRAQKAARRRSEQVNAPALRGEEEETRSQGWWSNLVRAGQGEGRIRLSDDTADGGGGGGGGDGD